MFVAKKKTPSDDINKLSIVRNFITFIYFNYEHDYFEETNTIICATNKYILYLHYTTTIYSEK